MHALAISGVRKASTVFEYGLISSFTGAITGALSSTADALARYGIDLLRFAVDNPVIFVLSLGALVGLVLFTRLR